MIKSCSFQASILFIGGNVLNDIGFLFYTDLDDSEREELDEFIICRLPLKAKVSSSDLFFHCNYANSENPEAWKEQYNSMTVTETALNDFEFKDIFGWGINEWLFDHSPVSINIDFTSASSKRQILDSTNPLFLYCEFQEHQYLFNYNGYT